MSMVAGLGISVETRGLRARVGRSPRSRLPRTQLY